MAVAVYRPAVGADRRRRSPLWLFVIRRVPARLGVAGRNLVLPKGEFTIPLRGLGWRLLVDLAWCL